MAKLKDQILESAKELFQEKGYEGVSLRAIAEHAGTTIGNLTYHYPQKEDLLVALQLSTQAEALTCFQNMPSTPEGVMREMLLMCHLTEEVCQTRSFYFCNIIHLCKDFPSLKKAMEGTREIVHDIYVTRFKALRDAGYMRSDIPDSVYESLASSYLLGVTSWLNIKRILTDKSSQRSLCTIMSDLAYPLLTPSGRALVQEIDRDREWLEDAVRRMRPPHEALSRRSDA